MIVVLSSGSPPSRSDDLLTGKPATLQPIFDYWDNVPDETAPAPIEQRIHTFRLPTADFQEPGPALSVIWTSSRGAPARVGLGVSAHTPSASPPDPHFIAGLAPIVARAVQFGHRVYGDMHVEAALPLLYGETQQQVRPFAIVKHSLASCRSCDAPRGGAWDGGGTAHGGAMCSDPQALPPQRPSGAHWEVRAIWRNCGEEAHRPDAWSIGCHRADCRAACKAAWHTRLAERGHSIRQPITCSGHWAVSRTLALANPRGRLDGGAMSDSSSAPR